MSSTTFVDGQTVIFADWLNDVNDFVYENGTTLTELSLYVASKYATLNDAITAIGSTKARLLVNTPVSVSTDLTIPSNITLRVEGAGLITISPNKRLIINGPFSAERTQHAFSCSLVSITVTANVFANALNIVTVPENLVQAGMVVEGTGITSGTLILADYGVTGVGQVALNTYQGVLSNRAMVLTGGTVLFAKGTIEKVYPTWFGAKPDDNTVDNATAYKLAVYSVRWGGTVHWPAGTWRCLSGPVFHAGLTLEGDGSGDTNTGSPPTGAIQSPTHVWLDADSQNLGVIGCKGDHITVRDMTFGASRVPGLVPVGTGRKGIVLNGHAPQFTFSPKFSNVYFFNFSDDALLVNDDWAGVGDGYAPSGYYWSGLTVNATEIVQGNAYEIKTVGTTNWSAIEGTILSGTSGTVGCRFIPNSTTPTGTGTAYLMPVYYDWGVNPGEVERCEFRGNLRGASFNTTNADTWTFRNCNGSVPANGWMIYLRRMGMLRLDTCFGFGAFTANSRFINIAGVGSGQTIDTVTLDNCQAEAIGHYLVYENDSLAIPATINNNNSNHQIGADIYLGSPCMYNSYNTLVQSFIYVDSAGVKTSSINDWHQWVNFSSGPTFRTIIVSGDADTIQTYLPGKYPSSSLTGPIIGGVLLFGISGSGSPSGVITPKYLGQEYFDTSGTNKWYKSTGLTNTSWVALN